MILFGLIPEAADQRKLLGLRVYKNSFSGCLILEPSQA